MSIEFNVATNQKVMVSDLRRETQLVLQELLNLTFLPSLTIKHRICEQSLIGEVGDHIVFEVEEHGEADIMYLDLPYDETSPESTQRTAVISAGGFRTDLSVAITIASAIALARMAATDLVDDSLLLSTTFHVEPDTIVAQLKLKNSHDDLDVAAHELLESRHMI